MFGSRNKPVDKSVLPYLNLGCGRHFHAAWTNVDLAASAPGVLQHDLLKPLPFPKASFAVVYHSHVLEHLPRGKAPEFLAECHRVLQAGGTLRAVVPDLETIARLYLESLTRAAAGDAVARDRHEWMTIELLDQLTRDRSGGEMLRYWRRDPMPAGDFVLERLGAEARDSVAKMRGRNAPTEPEPTPQQAAKFRASGEIHRWMYDRLSLRLLLEQCGFDEVTVCTAHESRIPDFARFALDTESDGAVRKPDSLFVEARKPAVLGSPPP